jgi:hypothetical protein
VPTTTPKGQIPKPAGNETATRVSITNAFDKIDEQFDLEPFLVRPAQDVVYDTPTSQLRVSYGAGSIRWGLTVRRFAAGQEIRATPTVSTTYYLVANSAGTVTLVPASGYTLTPGQVILGQVATANPVANGTLVWTDLRGSFPNSDTVGVGTITVTQLADGLLTADATGRAKMVDGYITTPKLADGLLSADAAGRAKMAAGYINGPQIGTGAIVGTNILAGAIDATKLATGAKPPTVARLMALA